MSLAFGPVPSRRLGTSLGVNNIPDKICTYACVYCQIGNTLRMEIERREFYNPQKIHDAVAERITGEEDYITFVPDGEPTLDINLDREAELLRSLGPKLAIITNASLIYREDVRNDLLQFDYVSVKLDAVSEMIWRFVDRPHKSLEIEKILSGLLEFRDSFSGTLTTETMLISGVDYEMEILKIAEFLRELRPDVAYIAVPTRPPAESWVRPADEYTLQVAHREFSKATKVELLNAFEGVDFSSTGDFEHDIMSITAVHPMREEAVRELMRRCNATEDDLKGLIESGKIIVSEYGGLRYYMQALPSRRWMKKSK